MNNKISNINGCGISNKKILVTDAGGMVGSHMIELLYNNGIEVIGTYYKPTIDIKNYQKK